MQVRFGTDGVRGKANGDLTPEVAMALGYAAATLLGILALRRARLGTLDGNGVVVTRWSNLGLLHSLRGAGLAVEVCEVGDRFVAQALDETGYVLGGEQSGHVIIKDVLQVGDGISTAIELLAAVVEAQSPLGELAGASMRKNPQVTRNLRVTLPPKEIVRMLEGEVKAIDGDLGENGRLVLRPSGTEPVVRIMAEARTESQVAEVVERVVGMVRAADKVPSRSTGRS